MLRNDRTGHLLFSGFVILRRSLKAKKCLLLYRHNQLLAFWSFVAAKVFLGFNKQNVLAELLAVLAKLELFGSVHAVFARVVDTLARLFADQTNNFALIAFFSHVLTFLCNQSEPS